MNSFARRNLILLLLLFSMAQGLGQEWTRFRGPNGSGIGSGKTIPSTWTEKDFNWRVLLPGPGHSSPVLWGDKVFLATGDDQTNRLQVLCLSAGQGHTLWQKSFPLAPYHKNALNSVASTSPAVDEHRVYLCWTEPEHYTVIAFDHNGTKAWERDLGPYHSQHGGGSSPILYQDKVILADEQDGESFLIALDTATGQNRWKTPRKATEAAYSTPCLYESKEGRSTLIFTSHSHGVCGIDPDNGQALWEVGNAFDKRVVSSPVLLAGGLILGACGSGGGGNYVVAVRPGESLAKMNPELAWSIRKSAPYVPTSICVGELLFLWGDDGLVSCVQAGSGQVKWQEPLGKHFYSSPVCVNDRLFCVSTTGEVVVISASDRFQLLARNALGETTHSTPAVAGGRMYIHTIKHLVSVGGREPTGSD